MPERIGRNRIGVRAPRARTVRAGKKIRQPPPAGADVGSTDRDRLPEPAAVAAQVVLALGMHRE